MQTGPPLGVFSQTVQARAFGFSSARGLASGGASELSKHGDLPHWSCVLETSVCSLLPELS